MKNLFAVNELFDQTWNIASEIWYIVLASGPRFYFNLNSMINYFQTSYYYDGFVLTTICWQCVFYLQPLLSRFAAMAKKPKQIADAIIALFYMLFLIISNN